jgi:AcrR family transcriptional regulator
VSREQQILDAAAALFYEKGFHGVGVDQIGERVGISGPALYRHFKGKDEILAALFNEALEELISATAAHYSDPHRDLERLIRHHIDFAINHRHLVSVYEHEQRSLVEPWKGHFQRRQRHYASRWEEVLARSFPGAPPQQIAAGTQAAIGLIHSVAHWPPGARKAPDLTDLLYRLVTHGLAALEHESVPVGSQGDLNEPAALADAPAIAAGEPFWPGEALPVRRGSRGRGSRNRAD